MKKSERKQGENSILPKMFSMISEIRENMVTRNEFQEFRSEVFDHIDGFVKLHSVLDTEVASLRHSNDNLTNRMIRVEKKLGLESL